MQDIIVIGAGASGLMAAARASANRDVLLLEKMPEAGIKLRITGGKRCNITHDAEDMQELLEGYARGSLFLYSVFSQFGQKELIEFFHKIGIPTMVDRGGRIFPKSEDAEEVARKLLLFLKKNNVKIKYNQHVKSIYLKDDAIWQVKTKDSATYLAKGVILATGGVTYPKTGSTGDGYRILGNLSHTITPLKPSLVPLEVKEPWAGSLSGLSLKNVEACLIFNGKKIASRFGDMLFTHFGISGPVILYLSRSAVNLIGTGRVEILINLKPALSKVKLSRRIDRDFTVFSGKAFKNSLTKLLPKSLIPVFVRLSGIAPDKVINHITKKEKDILLNLFQGLTLTITRARSFYEAEVTQGGVVLDEIMPKTMESKKFPGLFVAGEILDIDGYIGGYNLQAAFSTGWIAGKYAADSLKKAL